MHATAPRAAHVRQPPRIPSLSFVPKLGRGGLTDIEWTVQLLTMMHAHEFEDLHEPSTLRVLDAVEKHELVPAHQAQILREAWLMATDARNVEGSCRSSNSWACIIVSNCTVHSISDQAIVQWHNHG